MSYHVDYHSKVQRVAREPSMVVPLMCVCMQQVDLLVPCGKTTLMFTVEGFPRKDEVLQSIFRKSEV